MTASKPLTRKIMLLGEIGVGKTSIARRLSFNSFDESYKASIGSDIYTYDVEPAPDGIAFRFFVWDTDGSFGEAIMRHVSMKQAHAAMIVGDATRPATLDRMARLGDLFCDTLPGRYVALIVNKLDLLDTKESLALPKRVIELGLPIAQTSAKTGENVKETFFEAATTIKRREAL